MAVATVELTTDIDALFGQVNAESRTRALLATAAVFQDTDIYAFDFGASSAPVTIWDDALDVRTACL
ncbi:MAG: hypothetical protein ABR573_10960 [Candidatus Dormibacteria bacterium]